MPEQVPVQRQRQRAPSLKAVRSRERILDAAEQVFADRGFDGARIRDIAAVAQAPVGLVHHHGGGKLDLFTQTVMRRATELSELRLTRLQNLKATGPVDLDGLLQCFLDPVLDKAESGGPQWRAYARLVAHVSSDARWRDIAAHCFDPTANRFITEIHALCPSASRQTIASGFVFTVSALLALVTSRWRIDTLGSNDQIPNHRADLIAFCRAGLAASVREAELRQLGEGTT